MNIRCLITLSFLVFAISPAASQDVVTYVWDAGCNHTMTTNHFVLPAQGTAEVYVDLSKCSDEQLGSLLFFGYKTTKNRSRQLTSKDKIALYMTAVYLSGNLSTPEQSDSGSLLVDVASAKAQGCRLMVKNKSRNKEIKIRLRSQLVQPIGP